MNSSRHRLTVRTHGFHPCNRSSILRGDVFSKENYEIFTIEKDFKNAAQYIAKKRRDFHRSYNTKRHWDDPLKGEYGDEYWGVLGEILFRNHIKQKNLKDKSDFPKLFTEDQKNLPKYDVKICDKKIEVKSIPPDSHGKKRIRLLIKESEFHNDDFFIAIKFWDDNTYSICGYITLEEVLNTKITQLKYSKGYSFFLKDLQHIKNFWDIFAELV